eukprot:TRINITY_DN5045_c0_g1_i5.p1 TRINITY_DN5045_c0_g1~~TRINITY_DN5045_c0_g1_i5.p1  ORF type:complete len:156 (+),score=24.24 TRINITY_DN5045_c0_g1_i5:88-555(+)
MCELKIMGTHNHINNDSIRFGNSPRHQHRRTNCVTSTSRSANSKAFPASWATSSLPKIAFQSTRCTFRKKKPVSFVVILVCYAAVIADLVQKTNTTLKLGSTDGREELKSIRMRTRKGVEIIVTVASGYTLVVLQDCTAVADVRPKDAKGDDELK